MHRPLTRWSWKKVSLLLLRRQVKLTVPLLLLKPAGVTTPEMRARGRGSSQWYWRLHSCGVMDGVAELRAVWVEMGAWMMTWALVPCA